MRDPPNRTQIGVLFCTESIFIGENQIPCAQPGTNSTSLIYALIYNSTSTNPFLLFYKADDYSVQQDVTAAKLAIDQGLLAYTSNNHSQEQVNIEISLQPFPKTASRYTQKYNVVSNIAPLYLLLPAVFIMSIILQEAVKEKSQYLKIHLHLYGASSFAYWASWALIGLFYSIVSGNLFALSG